MILSCLQSAWRQSKWFWIISLSAVWDASILCLSVVRPVTLCTLNRIAKSLHSLYPRPLLIFVGCPKGEFLTKQENVCCSPPAPILPAPAYTWPQPSRFFIIHYSFKTWTSSHSTWIMLRMCGTLPCCFRPYRCRDALMSHNLLVNTDLAHVSVSTCAKTFSTSQREDCLSLKTHPSHSDTLNKYRLNTLVGFSVILYLVEVKYGIWLEMNAIQYIRSIDFSFFKYIFSGWGRAIKLMSKLCVNTTSLQYWAIRFDSVSPQEVLMNRCCWQDLYQVTSANILANTCPPSLRSAETEQHREHVLCSTDWAKAITITHFSTWCLWLCFFCLFSLGKSFM